MDRMQALNRRHFVVASAALLLGRSAFAAGDVIDVYKSPSCGCCTQWIEHLRAHGFAVKTHEVTDVTATRARLGIPQALGSCHSASVGGFVIEGHVPAKDIQRLLRERPVAAGLAVPGMARGSPGMEADVQDRYDVLLFQSDGRYTVYQRYGAR